MANNPGKSNNKTPAGMFQELDAERQGLMYRLEELSRLTDPTLLLPNGYTRYNTELSFDYQSLGGQALQHLSNKLMLTLFSLSRPFFRLDIDQKIKVSMIQESMRLNPDDPLTEGDIDQTLSNIEHVAIKMMNKSAGGSLRSKLLNTLQHLAALGNVLLIMKKDTVRVVGLKNYVCKRDIYGELLQGIVKDTLKVCQLSREIQESPALSKKKPEDTVDYYQYICRNEKGDYEVTHWIDNDQLPKEFNGKYPKNKLPYLFLTWKLADGDDYGIGHVETYAADLRCLSALTKAVTEGSILASEFRWLVKPGGGTSIEDLEESINGAAIPGFKDDIIPLHSGTGQVIQQIAGQIQYLKESIGRGFLMNSAVTRNAERVTAMEIQHNAQELETSLGGAYSRIAVELQVPVAYYLLDQTEAKIDGKSIEPIVITGMDSLSRGQDVDNLLGLVGALAQVSQLNPQVNLLGLLKLDEVGKTLAAGFGVDLNRIMADEKQLQQAQQQAYQAPGPETSPQAAAEQQAATPQAPPQ